MKDLLEVQLGSWTLKIREPIQGDKPHPVIILIHGWTGDEGSMWVFAPRLPQNTLLIAPRAPYVSNHPEFGGCSWVERRAGEFSQLSAFDPALGSFESLLTELALQYPDADFTRIGLAGFSQGAAFSFAYALRHPQRVSRLAALAGFLPSSSKNRFAALDKIPIFIAHGTRDETVPVAKAREAHTVLVAAGVSVQYCESETGHKLGANCLAPLGGFFSGSPPISG
ncbi:MAG: alpha/beta fold hydrolase [Anaerolineales bacterium]